MKTPKLKMDDNGVVTVTEGDHVLPVLTYEDGTEKPLDYIKLIGDVKRVSEERETIGKERDEMADQYDALKGHFNGQDPEEWMRTAREALETVSALDAGDLTTKERLQQMREEMRQSWEKKVEEEKTLRTETEGNLRKEIEQRDGTIKSMRLNHAFLASPFVRDRLSIPPDMAQLYFGRHFEDDNGRLRAKNAQGKIIRSRANPSEEADFEDAISQIVEEYPDKERIWAGSGASGPGSPSSSSSTNGSGKSISRSELARLAQADPARAHDLVTNKGYEVVD